MTRPHDSPETNGATDDARRAHVEKLERLAGERYDEGRFDEALEYGLEAVSLLDGLPLALQADVLNIAAITYGQLGNRAKTLELLLRNLETAQRLGRQRSIFLGYNNLGYFHLSGDDLELARPHFEQAALHVGDNVDSEALLSSNLATYFIETGDLAQAERHAAQALNLAPHAEAEQIGWYAHVAIARIRQQQGRLADAIWHFETVEHAGGHGEPMADSLSGLAECHRSLGDHPAAIACLERALARLEAQTQRFPLMRCCEQLYITHKEAGRPAESLEFLERFTALRTELHDEQNDMQLRALQAQHRVEILRQESDLLRQRNEELQRFNETVRELSIRDELSGLYNRRHLIDQLTTLRRTAHRYERPLTVAMLDLDHFKAINDRFGHQTGDDVIRTVASILTSAMRNADVIARYGGEEFAVVMAETDVGAATITCDRVRAAIAAHDWSDVADDLAVRVSIGVAADWSDATIDDLLGAADDQLYRAKRAGRNRVCATD